MRHAARRVAEALGLPDDWLNDGAKGFIHGLALGDTVFEHEAFTVRALAPEQLLAMKLCAWRDAIDFEDARLLLTKVGGERAQVWAKLEPFLLPGRETTACYAFDDIWESAMTPATLADAACAALRGDHLVVRQWAIDNLRGQVTWSELGRPEIRGDALSIAAALVELMAGRAGQAAPGWAADVPAASESIYFVPGTLPRSREVSETDGPEPLRRRRIYAMPNYLAFA